MTIEALVVYDVATVDPQGQRRLRLVARACEGIGVRVQKSVFELRCSPAQLVTLKHQLELIVEQSDRVFIYRLRSGTLERVECLGGAPPPQPVRDVIL